jgi:hypothetical protein
MFNKKAGERFEADYLKSPSKRSPAFLLPPIQMIC